MWEIHYPDEAGADVCERLTAGQVLATYWDWWSGEMRRRGLRGINPARCVADWAVVHWAREVEPEKG